MPILVPRNFRGSHEKIVFKAQYHREEGRLFWYLDGQFLAETAGPHDTAVELQSGKHRLVVEDEEGVSVGVGFRAVRM